jgi:hypothetical protein
MAAGPGDWLPTGRNRELWSKLDAGAIERAARYPFVILDVHFTDAAWWHADSKAPENSKWPATVSEQRTR